MTYSAFVAINLGGFWWFGTVLSNSDSGSMSRSDSFSTVVMSDLQVTEQDLGTRPMLWLGGSFGTGTSTNYD